eukprot:Seg4018.2 transcript_id=Seg4018.2/GoldUCD/mRNA.D3Y31 product="hypothetical protein" protein_id=Seg4018.2/GoldUCD/D3Y31
MDGDIGAVEINLKMIMLELLDTDGLLGGSLDIWAGIIPDPYQLASIITCGQDFPRLILLATKQLSSASEQRELRAEHYVLYICRKVCAFCLYFA